MYVLLLVIFSIFCYVLIYIVILVVGKRLVSFENKQINDFFISKGAVPAVSAGIVVGYLLIYHSIIAESLFAKFISYPSTEVSLELSADISDAESDELVNFLSGYFHESPRQEFSSSLAVRKNDGSNQPGAAVQHYWDLENNTLSFYLSKPLSDKAVTVLKKGFDIWLSLSKLPKDKINPRFSIRENKRASLAKRPGEITVDLKSLRFKRAYHDVFTGLLDSPYQQGCHAKFDIIKNYKKPEYFSYTVFINDNEYWSNIAHEDKSVSLDLVPPSSFSYTKPLNIDRLDCVWFAMNSGHIYYNYVRDRINDDVFLKVKKHRTRDIYFAPYFGFGLTAF